MKYKNIFVTYLKLFFMPIILVLPIGLLNYVFLKNSGELLPPGDIVKKQFETDGIYGSALHNNHYIYKYALFQKIKPEIIIVGSSRVLTFREQFFESPFLNMGRTVGFALELERFVDDMLLNEYKPKFFLLGIDFWWANPNMRNALNFDHLNIQGGELSSAALLAPTKWLIKNKFSFYFFYKTVTKSILDDEKSNKFGLSALVKGDGYAKDGSYYYTSTVFGKKNTADYKFMDTIRRINLGTSQFRYSQYIDDKTFLVLKRVVEKIKSANIQLITFLMPLPPVVYDHMLLHVDNYLYIEKFRRKLYELGTLHFDYHNPETVRTNDCEYIDGFHGGEIVSARVLKKIASSKNILLNQYVNINYLEEFIAKNEGMAGSENYYKYIIDNKKENDFLGLGCEKNKR